ncbi:MAG: hypothetical protein M3Y41_18605, partial [Pseudomonadota bacterium]|nr:hypothetical protein [Pseudomonadota bacterium]
MPASAGVDQLAAGLDFPKPVSHLILPRSYDQDQKWARSAVTDLTLDRVAGRARDRELAAAGHEPLSFTLDPLDIKILGVHGTSLGVRRLAQPSGRVQNPRRRNRSGNMMINTSSAIALITACS